MILEEQLAAKKLSEAIGLLARLENKISADVLWRMTCDCMSFARGEQRGANKQDRIHCAQMQMLDEGIFDQYREYLNKQLLRLKGS